VKRFVLVSSLLTNAPAIGQAENPNYKASAPRRAANAHEHIAIARRLSHARARALPTHAAPQFLNALGGILDEKLSAEKYLAASGLTWTVIRPGGLSNDPPSTTGNPLIAGPDTFLGLPEEPGREVSRDTVAEVVVAALTDSAAQNATFELVASLAAPPLARADFFAKR
jgi:uncharacterized protein YbjT (DUF2867 family)